MKILFCADLHSNFSRLFQITSKVDLCICCGDIFDYHTTPTIDFRFPLPFYSVKGNKELWGREKISTLLESCENFFWLNMHLDELEEKTGLQFFGINHRSEPKRIPNNIDILVTHQPAYGLADQCRDPFRKEKIAHCGSKKIRHLIDDYQPELLVAGHLHWFQQQQSNKTHAITLAPALTNPILLMTNKSLEFLEL